MVGVKNQFSFTKLLVDDLERCAVFYKEVCGLVETGRVESEINGRAISEILFAPTSEGGATFVLLKFAGSPRPHNDEVITGFITDDVDAFCVRVEGAGGRVTQSAKAMPEHGVRVAFVEDVEGHLIEVVQLL
jgi:lactoylglutathione lyase